jgi:hypothetical protein
MDGRRFCYSDFDCGSMKISNDAILTLVRINRSPVQDRPYRLSRGCVALGAAGEDAHRAAAGTAAPLSVVERTNHAVTVLPLCDLAEPVY